MSEIRLRIADFEIGILSTSEFKIELDEGYNSFVSNESSSKPDVTVRVHVGFPDGFLKAENVIYEADFNGSCLWKVLNTDNGLRFHVFDPNTPDRLQQIADLNADKTEWNIYTEHVSENGKQVVVPLAYPMGPLIMYYLTAKFDAVMIHGSGISDSGLGRIFTGVSGKGKTTMAKLWFDAEAEVLNDDRLIIRKSIDGYTVYNTPMFYEDRPRSANLRSIHSIYHAPKNEQTRLRGADALNGVSANLIQHGYSAELISHHLNFVSELINTIPVYRLGFLPNAQVIDVVRKHDEQHA